MRAHGLRRIYTRRVCGNGRICRICRGVGFLWVGSVCVGGEVERWGGGRRGWQVLLPQGGAGLRGGGCRMMVGGSWRAVDLI